MVGGALPKVVEIPIKVTDIRFDLQTNPRPPNQAGQKSLHRPHSHAWPPILRRLSAAGSSEEDISLFQPSVSFFISFLFPLWPSFISGWLRFVFIFPLLVPRSYPYCHPPFMTGNWYMFVRRAD